MKKFDIPYDYVVHPIGTKNDPAYEAFVPAINAYVYGADQNELEEGIAGAISVQIQSLKKRGATVPAFDRGSKKSGKLILRIEPALHNKLALGAKARGMSLNRYIEQKVSA
ncbi:MAG: hypothetical protein COV07_01150 [Candidatus Vogelbacteria bacterium CG10_big_fil_rev_8_21_14_0_10_45_14]|uniref:Toxin-antitoxin system HicB family antitoxin n=1 Tax=Candidatus Vogelbacteria bacterium CG10_big_fil_rev_8_21_14_0_10_45_14 TaxID=1975042 RepID=A0A2H0RKF0_9BACT|nr:MAG: hypothetical protein COV07_01150 [Candidatus Vogelbacteria bacterium CG10_big_fil_rev_8_21_14_0_10_45_14]